MPTYLYFCPVHKEFEEMHSINEELTECPKCKEESLPIQTVKKLISKTNFVLVGSGWGKDNYHK